MAAYGSARRGALDPRRMRGDERRCRRGTSKIAVCAEGKVIDLAAVDVGARLVCLKPTERSRESGRRPALRQELGIDLQAGRRADPRPGPRAAGRMADKLFEAMRGGAPTAQGVSLPTHPLAHCGPVAQI